MRKLSGINVNYIYKTLLFRVIRIYFKKKKRFTHKYKQQKSWSNKNNPGKFPMHCVCSTPGITLITAPIIQFFSLFFFLHNLKLKTEVISD